ncbi:hypothetical protein CPB97_002919 [Podila verticillata]|nr:hypothetical protein CPB97_002919 [Podila verticillata]
MSEEKDHTAGTSTSNANIPMPDAKAVLEQPVVLIVGAGIAGLTTALLCEKAGIEYFVFECEAEVKPLGSAMSLCQNVLGFFEQIELLEDLQKISLPVKYLELYKENLKLIDSINGKPYDDLTGYCTYVFARSDFYGLLLSKIQPTRIFMNKKIKSIQQNAEGVMIRCINNTNYHGDILVGADGAYSTVRQDLYRQLDEQGLLPKEDKEEMNTTILTMLGTTKPLDPKKYPMLEDTTCTYFSTVVAKDKPQCYRLSNLLVCQADFQNMILSKIPPSKVHMTWLAPQSLWSLDPAKYLVLKDAHRYFSTIWIKDKPISWATTTLPNIKIARDVGVQISA